MKKIGKAIDNMEKEISKEVDRRERIFKIECFLEKFFNLWNACKKALGNSGQNRDEELSMSKFQAWFRLNGVMCGCNVIKAKNIAKKYFNRKLTEEEMDFMVRNNLYGMKYRDDKERNKVLELLQHRKITIGKWIEKKEMVYLAWLISKEVHYEPQIFFEIPEILGVEWPKEAIDVLAEAAPKVLICQGRFESYMPLSKKDVFFFWERIGYKKATGLNEEFKELLYRELDGRVF